jgi:hypothetical protein
MLLKNLSDICLQDVQTLCEDRVLESRYLDFKVKAVGRGDSDKRDFLADVCAFANASGGDLLFGVKTKDGAADEVCGIDVANPDEQKQFLVNLVRDGLEPRIISGLDLKWLPMEESRGIMIVRVHRSWLAPHRVTFLNNMKFYVRNPSGNHPMSVDELRQHFLAGREVAERLRAFRDRRISTIAEKDTPVALRDGPKVVLHVVPLSAIVDPMDLQFRYDDPDIVRPPLLSSSSWAPVLEGFATYTMPEPSESYTLMFRHGPVEIVGPLGRGQPENLLSLHALEKLVADGWERFLKFARGRELQPPFYVFATLMGIKGRKPTDDPTEGGPSSAARKDLVLLPEVVVGLDSLTVPPYQLLRRLFDVAANAFGLSGSARYRADGTYVG